MARAYEHFQIRCLIPDDIGKMGARPQIDAKFGQVTDHTAEIELCDPGVQALEARGFSEFDPASFDCMSDAVYFGMGLNELVVTVGAVHAASIRSDQILL